MKIEFERLTQPTGRQEKSTISAWSKIYVW